MNPQLLKVSPSNDHSFSIRRDEVPYFFNRWHYHPEVELIHIVTGNGTQFIGDNIQRFKKGDIILVGAGLPHFWRCDDAYFENNPALNAVAVVAHFRENFWGQDFSDLPESKRINLLLEKAKRGISVTGKIKPVVISKMEEMLSASGFERIILLLQILNTIANDKTLNAISSPGFRPFSELRDSERINKIYNYSLAHFKEKIYLKEISSYANISENSFCRYFKAHTKKTYNNFLQELRVGHASKLLIENKKCITQICYESGFNNVTNFYKSFKKIKGKTPLEYQKVYLLSECN